MPSLARSVPKPLKVPSLARSVHKPLKVPSLASSVPKPLKAPSLARSVPKPLKVPSLARSGPKLCVKEVGGLQTRHYHRCRPPTSWSSAARYEYRLPKVNRRQRGTSIDSTKVNCG